MKSSMSFLTDRHPFMCLALLPLIGLTACVSGPKKLAVCNGHQLRDVNIYGSVLPGSPVPPVTAPRAAPPVPTGSKPGDVHLPPPPSVSDNSSDDDKISLAPEREHYASC